MNGVRVGSISQNMRTRREAIGVSRAALARTLGTSERQLARWEGETAPPAEQLENIARALNISVSELLGIAPAGLDLSGRWHAVWDTTRDGLPTLNAHSLNATHSGEFVYFSATGDYDWLADLRIRDGRMTGAYQAVAENRQELGALYFVLHHDAEAAIGGWRGQWTDGILGQGFGVLARDEARAERLVKVLMSINGPITDWPRED